MMLHATNIPASPYDDAFFAAVTDRGLTAARVLVPLLLKIIQPRSVLDVGCGYGAWLKAFGEHGIERLRGLDGTQVDPKRFLVDPGCFQTVDLRHCPETGESFDLALCLEVAEHVPTKNSRQLVRFLTRSAPLVLFSAAIPGQGGVAHVNEQWPKFWQALFAEFGYRRLDPLRRHVWQDPRVPGWYQQNLLLYASANTIERSALLREEEQRGKQCEVDLIQGYILSRYQSLGGLLGQVPRELWRAFKRRLPGHP
jgi:SAM-dependent methyltransferase